MDKVQFVSSDGKAFFECSPAEARIAMDAVGYNRTLGGKLPPVLARAHAFLLKLLKLRARADLGERSGSLLSTLSDLFAPIEEANRRVTHVVMSAPEYAHLRKYHRSEFDASTNVEELSAGIYGALWGATIFVVKKDSLLDHQILVAAIETEVAEPLCYSIFFRESPTEVRLRSLLEQIAKQATEAVNYLSTDQPPSPAPAP